MCNQSKYYLLLLFLILNLFGIYDVVAQKCILPIDAKGNIRNRWPLVYQAEGDVLYETTKNAEDATQIEVPDGTKVLLSCGPNYLRNYRRATQLEATCNGESGNFTTSRDTAEKRATELICDLRVIEEVLSDVHGCENSAWTSTKFGYVYPKSQKTHIVGEACYDEVNGRTIFAHVKLGKGAGAPHYLQELEKTYLTRGRHPDGRYKIELFRGLHLDEIYAEVRKLTGSAPMLKMHNFIGDTLLSNAQYQEVKKLGWNYFVGHDELNTLNTLSADIKNFSDNKSLDVYIGSWGVYSYTGELANAELYLQTHSRKRFPMPKYIWLLVRGSDAADTNAFLIKNDASNKLEINDQESVEQHCAATSCAAISWLKQARNAPNLLCCSYAQLKEVLAAEMPEI